MGFLWSDQTGRRQQRSAGVIPESTDVHEAETMTARTDAFKAKARQRNAIVHAGRSPRRAGGGTQG